MSKVTILGDVHGSWRSLRWAMDQNPDTDLFIQVGDFGYWENLGRKIPDMDRQILFCDGNHEDHVGLAKRVEDEKLEVAKNVWYIPRASHFVYEGVSFNCIGGAESIDRDMRVSGKDWFASEVPSYAEFSNFANLPPADVVIAHTAPISVIEACFPYPLFPGFAQVENALEQVWQQTASRSSYYFYGHWHMPMTKIIKGTHFQCIPCTHEWNFKDRHVEPSSGVTLIVEDGKITLDV
jgi:hypothetical protein